MMQKMQQTLPIIPWMGGKRRLAKHLLPMFPSILVMLNCFPVAQRCSLCAQRLLK